MDKFKYLILVILGILIFFVAFVSFNNNMAKKNTDSENPSLGNDKIYKVDIPPTGLGASSTGTYIASTSKEKLNITPEEKQKILIQTKDEIISSFQAEKQSCINRLASKKINDLLTVSPVQAWELATCQGVKNRDVKECDQIKANKTDWQKCQEIVGTYEFSDLIFIKKDCSSGQLSNDKKNFCQGLISGDAKNCEKITTATEKNICLAIVSDKVSMCDKIENNKQKDGCRNYYYFAKAAQTNNQTFLENIKNAFELSLSKIYFNNQETCNNLLKSYNEEYCKTEFSDELLQRKIDIWTELNKPSKK